MASSYREEISRLELLHAAHPEGLVFPHLADAYRRAGRFSQAEDILNAGLRRHQDYSSAHVVLGRLRLDQGKRQEAAEAFRRVLQLDPQNLVALECLAGIAADGDKPHEALELYRRLERADGGERVRDRIRQLESRLAGASSRETAGVSRDGGPLRSGGDAGNGGNGGGQATGSQDQVSAHTDDVVTETMAELYTRQGLHERAAQVYRHLLRRSPADARLRQKLERSERAAGGNAEPAAEAGPRTEAGSRTEARMPDLAEPAPARGQTIRSQLRTVLAWSAPAPTAATTRPVAAPAPAASPPARDPSPTSAAAPTAALTASVSASVSRPVRPVAEPPRPRERPAPLPAVRPSAGSTASDVVQPPNPAEAPAVAEPPAVAEAPASAASSDGTAAEALVAVSDMLVGLLEFRDPFFRGSSSLTRLLATSVGREMGLSDTEQVHLSLAAVLRDLGRLALGGKLLPSPKVTPTPEGRRRIERHVDLALQLMDGVNLPGPVRLAVRHHHERWDGAGYPDALGEREIPRLARILAVVDSFVAMVSPRPYRLPRKVPAAAAELQEESGTRYDPEVVNALMRVLANREQPNLGFVQRHHILLVNPDQPGAVVTAAKLCSAGYLAEVTVDGDTARERLRRVPVAALVVSAEAGFDRAAAFIRDLRVDPLFSAMPIVVTEAGDVGQRVRFLESGADVCFPPGVEHDELQGTLGALVRRTLAPRGARGGKPEEEADAPWLALQGDVEDFPLTWLLQVMKYDGRTAAIGIRTADRQGVIYLRNGDAVHARVRNGASGEEALREMLDWNKGRFTVQPDARTEQRTISTSLMHLLLSQAVHQDHAQAGIFGAVSAEG